jgi:hypothetical protein
LLVCDVLLQKIIFWKMLTNACWPSKREILIHLTEQLELFEAGHLEFVTWLEQKWITMSQAFIQNEFLKQLKY